MAQLASALPECQIFEGRGRVPYLPGLAETWNLDVAAFDLLDTTDGPVFLEVNSSCDWQWSERLAGGAAVSTLVAELVSRMFHTAGLAAVTSLATPTYAGVR